MKNARDCETFSKPLAASAATRLPMPLEPVLELSVPFARPDPGSELANELAAAQAIQQSLLPKQLPKAPGFGLAAFCQSAGELGGDFYDTLSLGRERVLLFIADVMGKGVPAALFAASLRMLVRSRASKIASTAELLKWINQQMFYELSSVD